MPYADLVTLLDLDPREKCDAVLRHRPVSPDSRVQWWNALLNDVVRDFDRLDFPRPRRELLDLALHLLSHAEQDRDLSPVDVVVCCSRLARLARRLDDGPPDLAPDRIAARALNATTLPPAEVERVAARERDHLLTDERAWHPSGSAVQDAEFDALDDLRRVLEVLDGVRSDIEDHDVRDQVTALLSMAPLLQHGPEIAARGRELLARGAARPADDRPRRHDPVDPHLRGRG